MENQENSEKKEDRVGQNATLSVPNPEESVASGSELTEKQKSVIPYLLEARNFDSAAKLAHVAKRDLLSWVKNPVFMGELAKARKEILQVAIEKLRAATAGAIDRLIVLSKDKRKGIQLKALQILLDYAFHVLESEQLEMRMEEIERVILEKRVVYK